MREHRLWVRTYFACWTLKYISSIIQDERMINLRLTWFLESNNLLSNLQTGVRAKRSTIDQIVRIETLIREAFIIKEHLVALLFDLEKAYDTTWPYGILKDRFQSADCSAWPIMSSDDMTNPLSAHIVFLIKKADRSRWLITKQMRPHH